MMKFLLAIVISIFAINVEAQQKTLLQSQDNSVFVRVTDSFINDIKSDLLIKPKAIGDHKRAIEETTSSNQDLGLKVSFGAELIKLDYSSFEDILGAQNTDYISGDLGNFAFEFVLIKNNFHFGFGSGFMYGYDLENDSLRVSTAIQQYSLIFGYSVLESKQFSIVPKCHIKWRRQRLLNNNIDRKISLDDYVAEKGLDLRFNQSYIAAYVDVSYKVVPHLDVDEYWSFGTYVGYIESLNSTPWVYTTENRLTSDRKLDVDNLTFAVYAAFNL